MSAEACALFSGGKDSTYAVHEASKRYDVETLVTVHADEGSYMYHVPAVELASLAAEAMGKHLVTVDDPDDELVPLKRAIKRLDVDAVVSGAVESEYQRTRIDDICDELGVETVCPLWNADPVETLGEIVELFDVVVTAVAADGLDETWLGRKLDADAVDELRRLEDETRVHPMGEGGEFETLVVGGPHMDGSIDFDYEAEWDGVRGAIRVTDARLVD